MPLALHLGYIKQMDKSVITSYWYSSGLPSKLSVKEYHRFPIRWLQNQKEKLANVMQAVLLMIAFGISN